MANDPCSEAEWILETIIDDFAESLEAADRVRFYERLVELLTERRLRDEPRAADSGDEPEFPQRVH